MAENYRFVRFTWLERRDLEALGREMSDLFEVKTLLVPTDDWDIIPSPFERAPKVIWDERTLSGLHR